MKVYVVTTGDYSDYRIVAVFSTRAKARKFVDTAKEVENELVWCHEYRIEPYDLDKTKDTWCETTVTFDVNGNVKKTYTDVCIECGHIIRKELFERDKYSGNISFVVNTCDKERAIKIAAERRRTLIAEGALPSGNVL